MKIRWKYVYIFPLAAWILIVLGWLMSWVQGMTFDDDAGNWIDFIQDILFLSEFFLYLLTGGVASFFEEYRYYQNILDAAYYISTIIVILAGGITDILISLLHNIKGLWVTQQFPE